MGFIVKIFRWLWAGVSLVMPFTSLLWGGAVYSGVAVGMYSLVSWTARLVASLNNTFSAWSSNVSSTFVHVFESVSANSFFQLCSYVLSLDVPFEWLRSSAVSFVGSWLGWIIVGLVICAEIAVGILAIYFTRSRLKKLVLGLDGSATS